MKQHIIEYVLGLLSPTAGKSTITDTRIRISQQLYDYEETVIDDFCKRHNICHICITGGYDCTGDHK